MPKIKILITGGHVTPAIAVIQSLPPIWDVVYIGRKHALEADSAISAEYQWIHSLGIPFRTIISGKLQRHINFKALLSLLKIPIGFFHAMMIVLQEKPRMIVSFGGYVAVPIAIVGWILRIPIITHEQTICPGLANRIIGKLAHVVCISWQESACYFKRKKVVVTGNPIRKEAITLKKSYSFSDTLPILYITGGNLGSQTINDVIATSLPDLLDTYNVIHQCGNAQNNKSYLMLMKKRDQLPKDKQDRYRVYEHIDADHIGWVLKQASIIISRAGANTVSEIIALKKPAILIPLPWAGSGEQYAHAAFLEKHDAGIMIKQSDLTPKVLLQKIHELSKTHAQIIKHLARLPKIGSTAAATHIVDILKEIVDDTVTG